MRRAEIEADAAQSGIALVTVLWLLLLLAVIAAGTLREARMEATIVRNGLETAKARLLAEAGVQRAILGLLEKPEAAWPGDGTPRLWSFADGEVQISVHDEAGKIDLNKAPLPLLRGLFVAAGVDERRAAALADAVADFRDGNNLRRLNGAEDRDYRLAGYVWEAKDAAFDRVAELRQVFGMTPELLDRVEHAVTVHSARSSIDPESAPRMALLAVPDIDSDAVDSFLVQRAERARNDDPDARSPAQLLGGADFLSANGSGNVFELRAEALSAGGARFVRSAVVRITSLGGAPFKVESWE